MAIPATGVDVATIIPEVVVPEEATSQNKFTPGRRMRGDTGRRGPQGPEVKIIAVQDLTVMNEEKE